jgi:hypothetical protein
MDSVWCRWALASRDRSHENSTRLYTSDRVTFEAVMLQLREQLRSTEKQRDDLYGQLNRQWSLEPTPASEVESDDA